MDLVTTTLLGRFNIIDLFIQPNALMRNRPEVYTFTKGRNVYVLESHSGGLLGHAHELLEATVDKNQQVKGAKLYFTIESEYAHSHPDTNFVYYVAKKQDGTDTYGIYELDTQKLVTSSKFGGGHYHGLTVREVITR